jgi:phosphoglycerol transferase MdoB-like AlkP superfamily enzyme
LEQVFQPKNVVVLVMESFSAEMMGSFNGENLKAEGYTTFTPFLDSLVEHSLIFDRSFANGHKSISALPSVLSSIPSLHHPFVLTPYAATNTLPSLPRLLKEKGYSSSFYHGAPNGSMGFNSYMNLIGVDEYYGMTEYGNDDDFDGLWGIWDEEFMQFFADGLTSAQQPFISTLFSVSSHHPFKVPERHKNKFTEGPVPISKCMSYSDMALKKFFAKLSQEEWFNNTLFVITADHVSGTIHFPETKTAWGAYHIPIIFYAPGDSTLSGRQSKLAQQLDIMPTVLDYLAYDKPYLSFGKSLLSADSPNFTVNTWSGLYQWFSGDWLYQSDGKKAVALYNYQEDPLLLQNLLSTEPERASTMDAQLKAFLQQYNNRILDNELVVQ